MALLINNEYVPDDLFVAEFQRLGGFSIDTHQQSAQHKTLPLRELAEQRVAAFVLLRQRAQAQGITINPAEVEARREQQWGTSSASVCGHGVWKALGDQLLVEKYCDWITRHELRPSRSESEAYYRSQREQFHLPEQVRVQQVIRNIELPEDEATARAAMQEAELELNAGASFRQVAERYSDCGGTIELGWIARGEMVPAFEEAVFALSKFERTSVFRTLFGLHLAVVLERRAAGYRSFDEVRSTIAKQLLERRKEKRIQVEVAEAMRAATTTIAPQGELPR